MEEFDHHCPVVFNCVGKNNHRTFIAFICCILTDQILYVHLSLLYFSRMPDAPQTPLAQGFWQTLSRGFHISWASFEAAPGMGLLFLVQVRPHHPSFSGPSTSTCLKTRWSTSESLSFHLQCLHASFMLLYGSKPPQALIQTGPDYLYCWARILHCSRPNHFPKVIGNLSIAQERYWSLYNTMLSIDGDAVFGHTLGLRWP